MALIDLYGGNNAGSQIPLASTLTTQVTPPQGTQSQTPGQGPTYPTWANTPSAGTNWNYNPTTANAIATTRSTNPNMPSVPTQPAPPQRGPSTPATPTTPAIPPGTFTGPANNPHDYQTIWDASNHDPYTFIQNLVKTNGLNQAHQAQVGSLNPILDALRAVGYTNATLDSRTDGYSKGIYLNGTPDSFVKLLDGNDNYIWQPGGDSGGNVFNDPATSEWETLLRQLVNRMNQPLNPATYQPTVDYLTKYFQQLQGPAYTPDQMDLLQTQSLDPLERQRQAAQTQLTARLAAQGITPSSGIAERAREQLDQQFQQQRTQTQSNFAANAVGLEQQRQGQAAQVGQTLTQLQSAIANNDEARAQQALSLFYQIPQLADQRLNAANNSLQGGTNQLTSLLSVLSGLSNNNNLQNSAFWQQLGQLIAASFA